MKILKIPYSDCVETIFRKLEYIAGRRGAHAEEFYRIHACDADKPMIRNLLEEAVAALVAKLGLTKSAATISADSIQLEIAREKEIPESTVFLLVVELRTFLSSYVVSRWLETAGLNVNGPEGSALENLVSLVSSSGPFTRRISPL